MWFLSVLMVYNLYSVLNDLIAMCTCIFYMPTTRKAWQRIQHGDYAFSIGLKDTNLCISYWYLGLCWDKWSVSRSLPYYNHFGIQQLSLS